MELKLPHILEGFCDVHLHVAPSLIPRYCDITEMAEFAKEAGYGAIVMKDHHCLSAPIAGQVKKHLFDGCDLDIFGSFCMNNATGGICPSTVESAICWGAKIIWMPTVSAQKHINLYGSEGKGGFPGTSIVLKEKPITVLDDEGNLKKEVVECIDLIAQSPSVVLATGHLDAVEVNAVVEKAADLGVKKIMIDHPPFCVQATKAQVKHWVELGAWVEHAGTISDPRSGKLTIPYDEIAGWIRDIGVRNTILSSDYGMLKFGNPVEGMDNFLYELKMAGITEEELKTMCCDNTANLLY